MNEQIQSTWFHNSFVFRVVMNIIIQHIVANTEVGVGQQKISDFSRPMGQCDGKVRISQEEGYLGGLRPSHFITHRGCNY